MTCYHPVLAYRLSNGDVVFHEKGDVVKTLSLPCGSCVGCKLAHARTWANRCVHEASLHEFNCFITLTYSPDKLPPGNSLRYRDFQLFMKKLRKRFAMPVRFFMCGEYGTNRNHPHYHALLFGINFPDLISFSSNASGDVLYNSAMLAELWPFGFHAIGMVTPKSAAYVARYSLKKVSGRHGKEAYRSVDLDTGEFFYRTPEFCRMSLKPAIGKLWLDKYVRDVYPAGELVTDTGSRVSPPRYYDKLAKRAGYDIDQIKANRELRALSHALDNTPERLAAREQVTIARLSQTSIRTLP